MKKRGFKGKDRKIYFLTSLLVASLAVIVILLALFFLQNPDYSKMIDAYTLPLNGYERVSVSVGAPISVILTSGCQQIVASTTFGQVESISAAIDGRESLRPNAHDLSKSILEEYDISVIAVKIEDLRDGIFYSKLVLQKGNKVLNLDSKPSDAIAIALRFDKPIFITKELLDKTASNIC